MATSAYFDHGVWNTNTAAGHSMWLPDIFDGSCGPASPFYSFVPGELVVVLVVVVVAVCGSYELISTW